MNPKPGTCAFTVGTCRKTRDIKSLEGTGDTIFYNGNNDEIFGLNITNVGLVCNTNRATSYISTLGGM
jgi:hypothetical protein